jgi:Leucine Rich repeat
MSAAEFPPRQRRRYTVSLRVFMLLVLVAALGLGWKVNRADTQLRAVARIKKAAGKVLYDYQFDGTYPYKLNASPWVPVWLRRAIGDEYFQEVTSVSFYANKADDQFSPVADLDRLLEFKLSASMMVGRTNVTGTGLAHLRILKSLRSVEISGLDVTDAALAHLASLPQLQKLALRNAHGITDAGMAHVAKMTELRDLTLFSPGITDVGIGQLVRLRHLQKLSLRPITDAGLKHLAGLTELQELDLSHTDISDAGLSCLKDMESLRTLNLAFDHGISDTGLRNLHALRLLRKLNLDYTWVSDAEVAAARAVNPGLAISRKGRPFPWPRGLDH